MMQVMNKVNNYIYILDNKIYVNLTNACTNDCIFCIRKQKNDVKGADMKLTQKPKFEDVVEQLEEHISLLGNGVTFCGYGEPLIELDLLLKTAKYIKEISPDTKIKVNTNGHANAFHKKNIVPLLKGCIDEVSISLNAQNESLYNKLCMPKITNAYNEMLDFAKKCVENNIKTTFSIVTNYDKEVNSYECKKIAEKIGANFRERPWIENGY
ncbi:radical SAM protein [bacterium]|nr:radical SAM protein [bacterium]